MSANKCQPFNLRGSEEELDASEVESRFESPADHRPSRPFKVESSSKLEDLPPVYVFQDYLKLRVKVRRGKR